MKLLPSQFLTSQAQKSMAFQHAAIFFTIVIFLWLILANGAQAERLRRAQSLRPTRMVKQRAFQNFDLLAARGYGKRTYSNGNYLRKHLMKNDLINKRTSLITARLYGKRDTGTDNKANKYLINWFEIESSENNDIFPRIIRDDEILLPD